VTIEPDTKDWTWVLQRPCPDCGLDTRLIRRDDLGAMIRANAAAWPGVLTGPGDPRQRPAPGRWSALEYGCHVRDCAALYAERLALMLAEDGPLFANWDQDETAVTARYAEQDPAQVAAGLTVAAGVLADRFDAVTGRQWQRTGSRSDGAHFTIETFGRYFIHDPVHHLFDVTGTPHAQPGPG
jgi:DinB superfamily